MIDIKIGDIAQCDCDIIVNSANPSLLAGGGVCGHIHKKAGPGLELATKLFGGCNIGEICHTDGFNLNCRYVIHAVSPRFIYPEYNAPKDELLASCYVKSLNRARELMAESIMFPSIGTGIYGWPMEQASEIAILAIKGWLKNNSDYRIKITLVFESEEKALFYRNKLNVG